MGGDAGRMGIGDWNLEPCLFHLDLIVDLVGNRGTSCRRGVVLDLYEEKNGAELRFGRWLNPTWSEAEL